MSNWGFVYCLANDSMPGIYKIGFTDRAPMRRIDELSSATGVPEPFKLFFFMQNIDAYASEIEIHRTLSKFRVSRSREFFRVNLLVIKDIFEGYVDRDEDVILSGDCLDYLESIQGDMEFHKSELSTQSKRLNHE